MSVANDFSDMEKAIFFCRAGLKASLVAREAYRGVDFIDESKLVKVNEFNHRLWSMINDFICVDSKRDFDDILDYVKMFFDDFGRLSFFDECLTEARSKARLIR